MITVSGRYPFRGMHFFSSLLTPDVALANVSTLTAGRDENDEELPARRARGTWVLVAQDGQWLISALRGLPAEGDVRVEPGKDR